MTQSSPDTVQMVADTIIEEMFAPHEVPLDAALVKLYRQVAQKVLDRLGTPAQALPAETLGGIRWQRVNDEQFEYAIQQGIHGDEFVRLRNGACLRRPLTEPQTSGMREALELFADPAAWRLGGSCDPNSGAFRGLEIAQKALASSPARCSEGISEEERHAIGHARYQVEHASPEKPECCFDYDLVKDLLRVIDRTCLVTRPERCRYPACDLINCKCGAMPSQEQS